MKVTRVHRLIKLITILQSGRDQDAEALAHHLGISRRTIFRDLKLLEHAGIPFRFESRRGGYTIEEAFFLRPLHFELQEALALMLVTRRFLARQAHPIYQKALDAAMKIQSTLPSAIREYCGEMLDGVSVLWQPVSSADASSDVFRSLQQAVALRKRIEMDYHSVAEGADIHLAADPLRLVFIDRGWYLLAWSHVHEQVRTFKLDRVGHLRIRDDSFEPDPSFSERAHFGAAWRMIPDGKIHDVKLRFSPVVADSVEEVQWHESQVCSREADESLIFEARVDGLREIVPWILGYAAQVEVLEPRELRDAVRCHVQRMLAKLQP
jgi:predicted DNA-binding transcriptional regulator YafY